ncbi:MAG: hypothetical protein ACRC0E_11050 [Soonwooa sp.]
MKKIKNLELDYQKKIKHALAFAPAILLAFLVVKLYQFNREKNKFIPRENKRLRAEREKLKSDVNEQAKDKIHLAN